MPRFPVVALIALLSLLGAVPEVEGWEQTPSGYTLTVVVATMFDRERLVTGRPR